MGETPKYIAAVAVSLAVGLWVGSTILATDSRAARRGAARAHDPSAASGPAWDHRQPKGSVGGVSREIVAGRDECPECPVCPRIAEDVDLTEFLNFDFERQKRNGDAPKFSGLSREELEGLAEKCEVRTEGIPEATPDGLSSYEEAAWESAATQAAAWFEAEAGALYETYVGEIPEEANHRDLWRGPQRKLWHVGDVAHFRQRVAQERAGLADPPKEISDAERLYRLWHGRADKFEELLAEQIGSERASDLRSGGAFPPQDTERGCPRTPTP